MLFSFLLFVNFPVFLLLISSFILSWSEKMPCMISIFFVKTRNLTCSLSWRMFLECLKIMCILPLLGGMFCVCIFGPFAYIVVPVLYFLIDLLSRCSIQIESGF